MKQVAYIVEDDENFQYRYRVKNVSEAILSSKEWRVKVYLKSRIADVSPEDNDLIVILRQTAKDGALLDLVKKARAAGVKVVFDLDDLVFDFRDLGMVAKTVGEKNIFYWAGYFWGVRRIAKKVDGFICTNEFLAGKLKRSFGKPVRVIPNSLSRKQVEVSEKWVEKLEKLDKVEKTVRGDAKFTIGYFSGSPTHSKDFQLVEPELIRFLETHNDAVLKIVGDMDYPRKVQDFIEKGRIEIAEKTDYLRLQGRIAKVDVNIAPLVINDFANCKSELKFFEAAVVETTTIASPTYTFEKAITDGKNGFLARPGEWYDKLEYLYEHPGVNREVARAARKYALKHYYGAEFRKQVEEVYDYFAKGAER